MSLMWEYGDEWPVCGTSTCPLTDLPEEAESDVVEYVRTECFCRTDEYRELIRRSPYFGRAMELWQELETGFQPSEPLTDMERYAVMVLKREYSIARMEHEERKRKRSPVKDDDGPE